MPPDTEIDLLRHKLSEASHDEIFRHRIVPRELTGAVRQDEPVMLFIAGQTGAGKSTLAEVTKHVWTGAYGRPAHICGDIYKPYHPEYAALRARDPRTAGAYTRLDSRQWHAAAESWVIEQRCDAINEVAPSAAQDFTGVARRFRAAGFRVEFAAIGVSAADSRLAIVRRFLETRRYVAAGNHDATLRGLVETAEAIDRDRLCDRTAAVRRGGVETYANRLVAGRWQQRTGFAEAIRAIRAEPWTESRSIAFCAELNDTAKHAGGSAVLRAELTRIAELAVEVASPGAPLELAAQGGMRTPFQPPVPMLRPLGEPHREVGPVSRRRA